MKTVFNIILFMLVVTVGIIIYSIPYSPCNTPLTYKIGSVDFRFGLSTAQVLADAGDAAKMLNQAAGKQLFVYASPSSVLAINFVYDRRTQLNSAINQQEGKLNKENATLQEQINSYEADAAAFEQKITDLNAMVQKYNSQGGAPPDVYQNLTSRQQSLKAEGDALNARARELNLASRDYNSQIKNLNQNVDILNQAISQKPEEGLYEEATGTITIYFADNKPELVHTLAHEFGHALGLDHVSNPQAIMYPYTTSRLTFTQDDQRELDAVCREIPLPEYWINILGDRLANLYTYLISKQTSN